MQCSACSGADVDLALGCPSCGAAMDERLAGLLGVVCRGCDGYNDPGARACACCGAPLWPGERPRAAAPARSGPPVVHAFPKGGVATVVPAQAAAPARPDGARRPASAALVLERGEGPEGATFRLAADETLAGGTEGTLRFAEDPCLAPRHATFFFRSGALHLRDEGSASGTFLKLRAPSVALGAGDELGIAERRLRYQGPLPAAAPPAADGTRSLGAPRPHGAAIVLEEALEGGGTGRVWVRAGPSVTIGRAGCAVDLGDGDPALALAHAEIVVEPDGSARLRDLGSPDGTFVRLPPHAERALEPGDRIRLGREVLRVAAVD